MTQLSQFLVAKGPWSLEDLTPTDIEDCMEWIHTEAQDGN